MARITNSPDVRGTTRSVQVTFDRKLPGWGDADASLFFEQGVEYAMILHFLANRVPQGASISELNDLAIAIQGMLDVNRLDLVMYNADRVHELYPHLGVRVQAEFAVVHTGHGNIRFTEGQAVLLVSSM